MKNFSKTGWIDCLRNRDWSHIWSQEDVNKKTEDFTSEMNKALDDIAPFKQFKVQDSFKPGLSDPAKKLMHQRDQTRKGISKASVSDRPALKAKYKQLRNRAIYQIRRDTLERNGERISSANNEGETWRVINEIINPKNTASPTLIVNGEEIVDELAVAESFNEFFVKKISDLKESINPEDIKDPLIHIKEKMKDKNLNLSLKPVTVKHVQKLMKQMAKKKSKGNDGIPQDCLLMASEVIAGPLTDIINCSIKSGEFPTQWKEAVVVPLLKKGDPKDRKNYRPVSCLPAASKVLEKVVCEQLTRFVEVHKLLPNNQHGFRAQRSTMTALTAMQTEWMKNTEDGLLTGVLVWDLSSAFDTLDVDLLLAKLEIYGADTLTLKWFKSFLINRSQRVRVGSAVSSPLGLVSGVPQGGILSPIVFTLYTADMELWLKFSKLFNFADDTTTDSKGKNVEQVRSQLEVDAKNVLQFMASNGLIANQAKTEFLVLNLKNKADSKLESIMVGNSEVQRTNKTKLLGVFLEDSQEWHEHFKQLRCSLNQRLFVIRRISNQIPSEKIMSVVHSLWMSKLRYGLQLCHKVRLNDSDKTSALMTSLQLTQNRLLRALNNTRIKDKISTKFLLNKFELLSVNQLSAKIKLVEVWKSVQNEDYPIKLDSYHVTNRENNYELRPALNRTFMDCCRLKKFEHSFSIDAAHIWNVAPIDVTTAPTLGIAKNRIQIFCKTLPI